MRWVPLGEPPFRQLISELRRRKVFRVAGAYAVVAFMLAQAADVTFRALRLPDWTITFVVALALIGFPAALILAWAFEVRPEPPVEQPAAHTSSRPSQRQFSRTALMLAVLTVVLVSLGVALNRDRTPIASLLRADAISIGNSAVSNATRSIAVLPFANFSGDSANAYFSAGVTEDITAQLAKISELHVVSRTSAMRYHAVDKSLKHIANELGVSHILEGSARRDGKRVRVVVQLINGATEAHVWAETYDRDLTDIFAIQTDVAEEVARTLRAVLSPAEARSLSARPTDNTEAYTLYLQGRHLFNRSTEADLRRSIRLYEEAITLDPSFARAYTGIADSWSRLADEWLAPAIARPPAKAAALKALEIDPNLAEARTALGNILMYYEWDLKRAEAEFRRAIGLDPKYVLAYERLSITLRYQGRYNEALALGRHGVALDPLAIGVRISVAHTLGRLKRFDEYLLEAEKLVELFPDRPESYRMLGRALMAVGKTEDALLAFKKAQGLGGRVAVYESDLAVALLKTGRRADAHAMLRYLEEQARTRYVRADMLARIYLALGDRDRALQLLGREVAARGSGGANLLEDPYLDPLRSDPRFDELLVRAGLKKTLRR